MGWNPNSRQPDPMNMVIGMTHCVGPWIHDPKGVKNSDFRGPTQTPRGLGTPHEVDPRGLGTSPRSIPGVSWRVGTLKTTLFGPFLETLFEGVCQHGSPMGQVLTGQAAVRWDSISPLSHLG